MTQIPDTLTAKLVHTVLIVLIVLYVVFVKKSPSAVESVPTSAKIVNTPSTLNRRKNPTTYQHPTSFRW